MPIASIKSVTRIKDLRQIGCVKGELEATFYIGVGYAVPTVTGHEWERSAQTLGD